MLIDGDHVFTYGLESDCLERCLKISPEQQNELDRRLATFDMPYGWDRFTFHLLRSPGSHFSMELNRKAAKICLHIAPGMLHVFANLRNP
jgi:hypothetical protein